MARRWVIPMVLGVAGIGGLAACEQPLFPKYQRMSQYDSSSYQAMEAARFRDDGEYGVSVDELRARLLDRR